MANYSWLQIVACLIVLFAWGRRADAQRDDAVTYAGRTAAEWAEVLAGHLDDGTEQGKELCRRAAAALGQIGPAAEVAVPPLTAALEHPSLEVRQFAAEALGRIGPAAAPAVPAIVAEMDLAADHINYAPLFAFRRLAARALGRIGSAAQAAVPALGRALQNEDMVYRVEAALALWRVLQQPRAIDYLAAMTSQTSSSGPYEAVMALGEIGPAAAPAVGPLVAALDHPQADVQRAAADVLAGLGPLVLEPVARRLQQDDLRSPGPAAYVLGRVAEQLREQVFHGPATEPAAFDAAAEAVIREATPALIKLLSDPREPVRGAAQRSLSQMGLLAMPLLLNVLGSQDARARQAAIETLIRLEAHLPPPGAGNASLQNLNKGLLTPLMEWMDHADPQVRAAAFRAFAEISFGPEGQTALPLLRRGLRDENLAVRKYAAQAIRDLGG